jgi:hypothetical protein
MQTTNAEKRKAPRIEVTAAATIQILGLTPAENGESFPATIVDVSERGMRLRTSVAIDANQAVKIEMGDRMFLGEVCYCATDSNSRYNIGVVTEQCLAGLSGLQHLITALQPDSVRKLERV